MDGWDFGDILWSALIFFFWFTIIWMFIAVFADIFRRDMSGWAKAGWIFFIIILPFLGMLVYVIARPKDLDMGMATYGAPRQGYQAADEIGKAARLHDEGKITDAEYERLKQLALNT